MARELGLEEDRIDGQRGKMGEAMGGEEKHGGVAIGD
jgi:hypothetical protein